MHKNSTAQILHRLTGRSAIRTGICFLNNPEPAKHTNNIDAWRGLRCHNTVRSETRAILIITVESRDSHLISLRVGRSGAEHKRKRRHREHREGKVRKARHGRGNPRVRLGRDAQQLPLSEIEPTARQAAPVGRALSSSTPRTRITAIALLSQTAGLVLGLRVLQTRCKAVTI